MPYIMMKRSDIPAGLLQILDLLPNTSQRRFPYLNPGQTKYIDPVRRDAPRLINNAGVITFAEASTSLEAWFLTNVNDGSALPATGIMSFTNPLPAPAAGMVNINGVLLDGLAAPRVPGIPGFDVTGGDVAAAAEFLACVNDPTIPFPLTPFVTAAPNPPVFGTADVLVTSNIIGTAPNTWAFISTGGAFPGPGVFVGAPWGGGADADALTTAEAVQDATDVLTLLGFGAGTPAAAMTLAAINGALTTGTITAGQLADILDIVAGRQYAVPAGVQIEAASAFGVVPAVGATGGPNFVEGTLRNIYETGALRISAGVGRLATYMSAGFTYAGATGPAVAVYNDDGTLFVP